MMNKFKAGDKVIRINGSWEDCIEGYEYIVAEDDGSNLLLVGDHHWYIASNFILKQEPMKEDMSVKTEQQIITAWLDKLAYVLRKDSSIVNYVQLLDSHKLSIRGDIVSIVGSSDLYQYVENTYDQLKSQELQKKSQKLLEQKEQLAKQLADVEKELESLK
jgi:hypothetical protein